MFLGIFFFIPGVNVLAIGLSWIISALITLLVALWVLMTPGMGFFKNMKSMTRLFGTTFLEGIPLSNFLPWWSISLILVAITVKREDRAYNKQVRAEREQIEAILIHSHNQRRQQEELEILTIAQDEAARRTVERLERKRRTALARKKLQEQRQNEELEIATRAQMIASST